MAITNSGFKGLIVKARLENGEIVTINNAHSTKDISDPERWEYLGYGTYYSVDGKRQRGELKSHFWKRKEKS